MNYENYKALKSAGKVSFSKKTKTIDGQNIEYVALTALQYNSETGDALDDKVTEITLNDLERYKSRADKEAKSYQDISDGLKQAITDIKAL